MQLIVFIGLKGKSQIAVFSLHVRKQRGLKVKIYAVSQCDEILSSLDLKLIVNLRVVLMQNDSLPVTTQQKPNSVKSADFLSTDVRASQHSCFPSRQKCFLSSHDQPG